MQYKLLGRNDTFMPIETIFENRGISNYKEFLNVSKKDELDYNDLDNIENGIQLLLKHLEENNQIELVVDSDVDGITSSAILYQFIKEIYPKSNLKHLLHEGKQHGLSEDIVISENTRLVILPDASSNDYEQHLELYNKNIDILVIDHHEAPKYSEYAVVINNQLSKNYSNKSLSGAGMVYKFVKAMDDYLFTNHSSKYLDLVALGNVADSMNLKNKETRFYVKMGLQQVNNSFLLSLINHNSFSLDGKYNITSLGWTIAPQLNGVIRSGTKEEKDLLFRAIIGDNEVFDYKPRGKQETIQEDLQAHMARLCGNIKSRQDNAVKKATPIIEAKIDFSKKMLITEVTKELNPNYVGLVAGKLVEKYNSPALLYRKIDENICGGSARGTDKVLKNLREFLEASGCFIFCQGHKQAHGFQFNIDELKNIIEYTEAKLSNIEIEPLDLYWVDFILGKEDLDSYIISEICKYEDEWGNGIEEPLMAFEDIIINTSEIHLLGNKQKNMVFEFNNVKFIKKQTNNDKFKNLIHKEKLIEKDFDIKITLIGRCRNNNYNGNTYSQVEIIDIVTEKL